MVSNIWARVYEHRRVLLIVGGAISLYIALCVYQINAASIWFDEAYSAWIIDLNPLRILSATAADVHPPLYYLLLQVWSFFAGSSETALRFLSTLFGAVTVGLTYIIARKFIGVKYAVFIPYVVALSPMLVRYGREARSGWERRSERVNLNALQRLRDRRAGSAPEERRQGQR